MLTAGSWCRQRTRSDRAISTSPDASAGSIHDARRSAGLRTSEPAVVAERERARRRVQRRHPHPASALNGMRPRASPSSRRAASPRPTRSSAAPASTTEVLPIAAAQRGNNATVYVVDGGFAHKGVYAVLIEPEHRKQSQREIADQVRRVLNDNFPRVELESLRLRSLCCSRFRRHCRESSSR
jgi:hypothetical protein